MRSTAFALIDQHGAALEQVAMPLEDQIERGIEQRLARTDERCGRFAGEADQLLLEGDPLVALEHRKPAADLAVTAANQGRDMLDLVAFRLALVDRAPETAERFQEERRDEMRLEPPRFSPFHVLPDLADVGDVHGIVAQRPPFEELADMLPIEGVVHLLEQPGLDLGLVAVSDRLQQQLAQRPVLEPQGAEDVEDLSPQGLALLRDLFEQPLIDFAFARVLGDEVPEVADLGLADAMDAAEALLQAVRVPGPVVRNSIRNRPPA